MISIIIPAYNEEKTIFQVLTSTQRAFQNTEHEIIVVDDGSTDTTGIICESYLNIKYIQLPQNHGKGFAIREGLKQSKGSFCAIQDADLEYNPETLYKLSLQAKNDVAIYGKRDKKQGYFFYKIGNTILSWVCNILYKSNLFDIYTCYKVIPSPILKSFKLTSNGFEIEAEITAKLLRSKTLIIEIPITYTSRTFEEGKKIRGIDAIIGIWTLIKNRFLI
ncbi:MAG: glycosyltransferase family 2 protein [Candidatus Paceibacterota bacterium]|jgi:glycosyltransferase involved in cell wall biosynthesis